MTKSLLDMSMAEIRERFRPRDEPFRSMWDALHKAHVKLLMINTPASLCEAAHLADRKHNIYCQWIVSRCS